MGLGLAIGLEHAFEPDHVVAVSTQVSKVKFAKKSVKQVIKIGITKSSILGIIWGAGHTTTLVLMGLLVYSLAITIQDEIFSGFEFLVGMMLVFLGVTTILNKKLKFKHKHPHQHQDGTLHFETHDHTNVEHRHAHKSYIIGLIHGLAGSGSLVALTASTLGNIEMVLSFIVLFGIGSIIGMALVSGFLGLPFALSSKVSTLNKTFRYVAGGFSFIIGVSLIYEIGVLNNLFGF